MPLIENTGCPAAPVMKVVMPETCQLLAIAPPTLPAAS